MFYSLVIHQGTKVLSRNGLVELSGDVYVDDATRDSDGAYRYTVDGREYICSSGCCEEQPQPNAYRHTDGLVWIA